MLSTVVTSVIVVLGAITGSYCVALLFGHVKGTRLIIKSAPGLSVREAAIVLFVACLVYAIAINPVLKAESATESVLFSMLILPGLTAAVFGTFNSHNDTTSSSKHH